MTVIGKSYTPETELNLEEFFIAGFDPENPDNLLIIANTTVMINAASGRLILKKKV